MRDDAILRGGIANIGFYIGSIGKRLGIPPRFEFVTHRENIGIKADAGIAEQVPRAAHIGALLDNRVALVRALHGQMRRRADPGQTRPHY